MPYTYARLVPEVLQVAELAKDGRLQQEAVRARLIGIIKPKPSAAKSNFSAVAWQQAIDRILLDVLETCFAEAEDESSKNFFISLAKNVYWHGNLPKPPTDINSKDLCHLWECSQLDLHQLTRLSVIFFLEQLMSEPWFRDCIPLNLNVGKGKNTPEKNKNSQGKAPLAAAVEECFRHHGVPCHLEIPLVRITRLPKKWRFSSSMFDVDVQGGQDEWQIVGRQKFVAKVPEAVNQDFFIADNYCEELEEKRESPKIKKSPQIKENPHISAPSKAEKRQRARQGKKEKGKKDGARLSAEDTVSVTEARQGFFASQQKNKSCCEKIIESSSCAINDYVAMLKDKFA